MFSIIYSILSLTKAQSITKLSIELSSQTKSNTETRAALIRRRIPLCNYCNYYPATHYGGLCWIHCDPQRNESRCNKKKRRETSLNEKQQEFLLNNASKSSTKWSPTLLENQESRSPMSSKTRSKLVS